MASNYPRLTVEEFGRKLLSTGDLDPVYVALNKLNKKWSRATRNRWLLAYFCYYDCGVACYMSQFAGNTFWNKMLEAAANTAPSPLGTRWKRASERRHARGEAAIRMVTHLRDRYVDKPEMMIEEVHKIEDAKCGDVMKWAKTHYLFGDWIGFKIADITNAVLGKHVDFSRAEVFMFKDPVKAALMLHRKQYPQDADVEYSGSQLVQVIEEIVETLKKEFTEYTAPPALDRPLEMQEIETILCKWKSHMNGHYPINNDIKEIRHSVSQWVTHSTEAQDYLDAMPTGENIQ